jgi:hypothetical protein
VIASSFLVGLGKSQTDIPHARTREKNKRYLNIDLKTEFTNLSSYRSNEKID